MSLSRARCQRCSFLRGFLIVAGGLVLLMLLRPAGLERLGPLLPTPAVIAGAIPALGVPLFLLRLLNWRRAQS